MRPRPDYRPKYPGVGKLKDKVAVITGAGSGIGRALALNLAARGARLALSDIDADGLAETVRAVQMCGAEVRADRLNVAERDEVLAYADEGSLTVLAVITFVNGIAEELFFRGAMYAAIPRHPVLWTTLAYVVATLATGNVMLGFAAIVVGAVCGLERRASGGVLAPILTHVTWSLSMLFLLPLLF